MSSINSLLKKSFFLVFVPNNNYLNGPSLIALNKDTKTFRLIDDSSCPFQKYMKSPTIGKPASPSSQSYLLLMAPSVTQ